MIKKGGVFITKNNTILYFTDEDLDGIGCEYLLRNVYSNGTVVHSLKSKFTDRQLLNAISKENYSEIYITDVVLKSQKTLDFLDTLNSNGVKIHLIDHHVCKLDISKYTWALVCNKMNDKKVCATYLIYKHLCKLGYDMSKYKKLTNIICNYDTWNHDVNKRFTGSALTKLMSIHDFDYIYEKLDCIVNNKKVFNTKDLIVIETIDKFIKNYTDFNTDNAVIKEFNGYKFAITYSNLAACNYLTIESVLNKHPNLHFGINIDLLHNICSIKTLNPNLDVSKIAFLNNGAGQKQVSGFSISEETLDSILYHIDFPPTLDFIDIKK